ncbi:unnamed protein product [Nezara viridula]|uniref:PDZ domain-containing protein n=1 Tax=Nezara viridula TaxID=85310 RepID=A0A9P0E0N7_NEZVI|nr:unnamed protein product [Nezara viridula]
MSDKPARGQSKRNKQGEHSDGEAELSPSQILERVKPDRVTVTKPEEDRRRRTIIVEKNSAGSYGFTLQSYGIHYKKEQEIEMITYVDYVEYDGPAYRAGMREGDVILSINGHDMEKTDHKTLVNFIKNCDSRMRMVVLFEDCVRKVELHMRYIQLQRLLQTKMSELERLCVREKELLEGKWKTHSLPARKKGGKSIDPILNQVENGDAIGYCRPTVSTEDMARATPPPGFGPPLVMVYPQYQYVDQQGRAYIIRPPNSSSEYLPPWPSPYQSRSEANAGRAVVRRSSASSTGHEPRGYHQNNGIAAATPNSKQSKARSSSQKSHHCNPCMQSATSPQDNTSLEAYDLASPCCNSHCVPSRRRRHHHKSKKSSSSSHCEREEWKENKCNRSGQSCPSGYTSGSGQGSSHRHYHHHHQSSRRYFNLVSQCSLHSCTSSEMNSNHEKSGKVENNDSSAASYTTSLSTDTLFWGEPQGEITRQHSVKSNSSQREAKPKSWDNLTTKAFGGYGFGYGYVERKPPKYVLPNKSSESLLLLPEYSDSSIGCDCLDGHSKDKASQTERRIVNQAQAPEITRL